MSEIYERNDRGFHGYGRQPVTCSYKGTAEVYESSAAGERHVWLKVSDGYPLRASSQEGVAFLHLNAEAVHDLIDRLQTWLADRSPVAEMEASK